VRVSCNVFYNSFVCVVTIPDESVALLTPRCISSHLVSECCIVLVLFAFEAAVGTSMAEVFGYVMGVIVQHRVVIFIVSLDVGFLALSRSAFLKYSLHFSQVLLDDARFRHFVQAWTKRPVATMVL